jgi:hypothetical protein
VAVLLDDNFTRTAENPLSFGGVYAKPSGVAALETNGTQLKNVSADTDSGAYHNITYDDDHWAELTAAEATDGPNFGPCVRMSTSFDFYYFTSYNAANYFLFEVIGGSYNQVDASVGTYTDTDVIYLEAQGDSSSTTVIGKIGGSGGTTVLNFTDTTSPITGGRPGILGYNGGWRASRFRAGDFATGGPFTLAPTANVAVSGTVSVTGTIAEVLTITPSAAVAVSGTVSVTGETDFESEFGIDAPMLVAATGTISTTGTIALGLSYSGTVAPTGTLSVTGTLATGHAYSASEVAVTGSLAVTGDIAYEEPGDEPFLLAPTANVAVSGSLSTAGETAYTIAVSVEPTAAVAVAGTLSLAGNVTYEAAIALAPAAAVAMAGTVSVAGEVSVSDAPIQAAVTPGWGDYSWLYRKRAEKKREEAKLEEIERQAEEAQRRIAQAKSAQAKDKERERLKRVNAQAKDQERLIQLISEQIKAAIKAKKDADDEDEAIGNLLSMM